MSFARHRANARIQCGECDHERIVTAAELQQAFPMPVAIERAEARLKCSVCGHRGARLIPIPAPSR